jgi:hypothetical protein
LLTGDRQVSNKIGEYAKFMLADKTRSPWADSPIQDSTIPIYLGNPGDLEPGMLQSGDDYYRLEHGREVKYRVESVLLGHDPINPFHIPLVMLVRAK